MAFKLALVAAGSVLALLQGLSHASADEYTYGFSGGVTGPPPGVQQLIINGTTTISASSTGWYDQSGFHGSNNPNYIAGNFNTTTIANDYFAFNLSDLSGPITSAVLNIYQPSDGYLGPLSGLTYTNYDVSTPYSTLISNQSSATGIYADLGSGVSYASTLITAATDGTQVSIGLDAAALSAIAGAEGGTFAIGGSLNLSSVPLPASLPMFGAALLALAGLSYGVKRKTAS